MAQLSIRARATIFYMARIPAMPDIELAAALTGRPYRREQTGNPASVPSITVTCGSLTAAVTLNVVGQTLAAIRCDILHGWTNPTRTGLTIPRAYNGFGRQATGQYVAHVLAQPG